MRRKDSVKYIKIKISMTKNVWLLTNSYDFYFVSSEFLRDSRRKVCASGMVVR